VQLFANVLKLQNFRARVLETFYVSRTKYFSARVQLFGKIQIFVHETFAHIEPLWESAPIAKLWLPVAQIFVHEFRNFFFVCEMSRTKHFPLACNFFQTFKVQIFVHKFGNFFGLRSVVHETFSARMQLFCKTCEVANFRAQVWKLFFVCKMSRTKHFPLACNFLQIRKVQFFVHKFGIFFWFAKLSRTKYFPRTCKKNGQVRIEPLGYMSAVTDYSLVVSPHKLAEFWRAIKMSRDFFSVRTPSSMAMFFFALG
jgi:hypothetical protein